MCIQTETRADVVVVHPLQRRIDSASAKEFQKRLVHVVEDGERHVVLDLGAVDFIDSAGLSAIIFGIKMLAGERRFVLAQPGETVRTLLQLTRMDKVITLYDTVDEALAALAE